MDSIPGASSNLDAHSSGGHGTQCVCDAHGACYIQSVLPDELAARRRDDDNS